MWNGLTTIVVGALGEPAHAVRLGAATAEHDHRQRRVVAADRALRGADLPEDVEARGVGQAQVEQQEVGLLVVAEAKRVRRPRAPAGRGSDRPRGGRRAARASARRPRRRPPSRRAGPAAALRASDRPGLARHRQLEHRLGPPLERDPAGRHGATKRDGTQASVEEDEVEREAHAEGVDAAATGEQEARAGARGGRAARVRGDARAATAPPGPGAPTPPPGAGRGSGAAGCASARSPPLQPREPLRRPSARERAAGSVQPVVQARPRPHSGGRAWEKIRVVRITADTGRSESKKRKRWRRQLAEATTTRARTTSSSTASCGSRSTSRTSPSASSRRR